MNSPVTACIEGHDVSGILRMPDNCDALVLACEFFGDLTAVIC
jgi:hypothetical protein